MAHVSRTVAREPTALTHAPLLFCCRTFQTRRRCSGAHRHAIAEIMAAEGLLGSPAQRAQVICSVVRPTSVPRTTRTSKLVLAALGATAMVLDESATAAVLATLSKNFDDRARSEQLAILQLCYVLLASGRCAAFDMSFLRNILLSTSLEKSSAALRTWADAIALQSATIPAWMLQKVASKFVKQLSDSSGCDCPTVNCACGYVCAVCVLDDHQVCRTAQIAPHV